MNAMTTHCMPASFPKLIRHYGVPGPRHTAYPTADHFVETFTPERYAQALAQRRSGAVGMLPPLALYVHIPFCESLCYFCACNTVVTRQHERGQAYLRYLGQEVDLHTAQAGVGQTVRLLHLGRGTPTFLCDNQLRDLMAMLRRSFSLAPAAECSIELDPRTVDGSRLAVLAGLGFRRLRFGVQDFDLAAQRAVHREVSAEQVFALAALARKLGFGSIDVDLMYGLPRQTPESFDRTLAQVNQLRPDRITLYAYAHRPGQFKPQRRISAAEVPAAQAVACMLSRAISAVQTAGYDHLGMDHFALPADALAVARRRGCLSHNFLGYSTQSDCDLIGLGVSATSKIGAAYSQNATTLDAYYDLLDQGRLPVARGLALSRDDLLRGTIIQALLCQGQLQFESVDLAYLIDFKSYFSTELETLRGMQAQGLVEVSDSGIEVTAMGGFFVHCVARVFDRYPQADHARARFSRLL